mgnify:CR=1 FL=1
MKIMVGCDIVAISRIAKLLTDERSVTKIFHPKELILFNAEHLAGIFAVKESAMKALSLPSDSWLNVEVISPPHSKPIINIAKESYSFAITSLDCSISHDAEYAFAVVTALVEE